MSDRHTCGRELLARGCVGSVERCSCGTLHIGLGPFSLRLSPEQFKSLLGTLIAAQSCIEEQGSLPASLIPEVTPERVPEGEPEPPVYQLASLLARGTLRGKS